MTDWYCSRPFNWLEIHTDGSAFVCCPAWLRRPVGNLLTSSWQEVWNSPTAIELRKTILNGSFHYCSVKRCPFLAQKQPPVCAAGQVVDGDVGVAFTQGLSSLPSPPRILNLSYDPRCNLHCPSCRQQPVVLTAEQRERIDVLTTLVMGELAPHIEELRISGHGDPFAAAAYRQVLVSIDGVRFPRLKRLHLHSNGLLWTAATWHTLANIHPYVHSAEISVDAADAPVYQRNRGGDFSRLLDNLAFIHQLDLDLELSCVVQHNNYHQMSDFVALSRRFGARSYFSPLINWGTWSRDEYRRRAVHRADHPDHDAFLWQLNQVALLPDVSVGHLAPLLSRHVPRG